MVNVVTKRCKQHLFKCTTIVQKMKYKGYCIHCFVHMFPNEQVSTNHKCKENEVVQFIQNQFPNLTITHDKTITNGCSRKRPDVFIDLGYQVLIVEIDEDEHVD